MRGLVQIWLLLALAAPALALEAPYAVEPRVRTDLDTMLSRVLAPERYLLHVSAEVNVRTGRRLVDGETILDGNEGPRTEPPEPMPGFVPEPLDPDPEPRPRQTREHYTTVEIPTLAALRVDVGFDSSLDPTLVTEAKRLVENYLTSRYPREMRLSYASIPMRRPAFGDGAPAADWKDAFFRWLPWAVLLLVAGWLLWRRRLRPETAAAPAPAPMPFFAPPYPPPAPSAAPIRDSFRSHRQRFLDKIIRNAEAFRLYYERLTRDMKSEVESSLQGLALDSVMEGLNLERAPATLPQDPQLEERMLWHEKRFDEFVQATEWQDQKIFGFLHHLSRERLMALANFESDLNVAIMLRFLPPGQSATVLDSLSGDRRQAVLGHMTGVNRMALSEIVAVEKQIRTALQRVPTHMMGLGSREMDFWGELMTESRHNKEILAELERSHPELTTGLKKYKFSLDDLGLLPPGTLPRALAEMDNEELCLALSAVPKKTADAVLDALSDKRREVIQRQIPMYRESGERGLQARSRLTRKIREAMAS